MRIIITLILAAGLAWGQLPIALMGKRTGLVRGGLVAAWDTRTSNFIRYSNDITSAAWAPVTSTVNSSTLLTFTGSFGRLQQDVTTEAGKTYTLSFTVRVITGNTALSFMHSGSATGNYSSFTASTTATRYSKQFLGRTGGGTVSVGIADLNGSGHGQVEVTGFQLHDGAVVLPHVITTEPQTAANLVAGGSALQRGSSSTIDAYDTRLSKSGWARNGTSRSFSTATQTMNLSTYTIHAVVKWLGTTGEISYSPIFGNGTTSDYKLGLHATYTTAVEYPHFIDSSDHRFKAYGVNLNDGKYHLVTVTVQPGQANFYIDCILEETTSTALDPISVSKLIIGGHGGGFGDTAYSSWIPWNGELSYFGISSTAHNQKQINQQFREMTLRLAAAGETLARPTSHIVIEGDSFSETALGSGYSDKWPYVAIRAMSSVVQHRNYALSGRTLAQMATLVPTTTGLLANAAATNNVYLFWGGPNDAAESAETIYSRVQAVAVAARAAGYNKIVTLNMLPRAVSTGGAPDATYNAKMAAVNALLAADHSFVDVLIDVAADAVMGDAATTANTTYYGDGWHPAAAGHTIIAGYVTTALNALGL